MNTLLEPTATEIPASLQLATFLCDDLMLGLDIEFVQEINRQLEVTPVPLAPDYVAGAINLRGDVVTVLDFATHSGSSNSTDDSRVTKHHCPLRG